MSIFLPLALSIIFQSTATQHAEFNLALETPNDTLSTSGILLNPLQNVAQINGGWELRASGNNNGFNLHLSLNDSWSFDSNFNTTLKIEIDSTSPIGEEDKAFLLSFSQKALTYFSTQIQIDETDDHTIYPQCTQYPATTPLAIGDVDALINQPSINLNRQEKAMKNNPKYFIPKTNPPIVNYPLIFILEQYPSECHNIHIYKS